MLLFFGKLVLHYSNTLGGGVNAWKKKTCNLKPPNLYVLYIISFRDWVDFANHIVISSFVFILEERKRQEGNLFLIYLF